MLYTTLGANYPVREKDIIFLPMILSRDFNDNFASYNSESFNKFLNGDIILFMTPANKSYAKMYEYCTITNIHFLFW